jgi:hypothetical protein
MSIIVEPSDPMPDASEDILLVAVMLHDALDSDELRVGYVCTHVT